MITTTFRAGLAEPSADDVKQTSQKGVLSLHVLTTCCHGVRNTVLVPPPTVPAWYPTLDANLAVAKQNAGNWIDVLAPQMTNVIPVQIINYGSTFAAGADQILRLLSQARVSGSSPDLVQQALDLMVALRSELTGVQVKIADVSGKLTAFGQLLQTDHDRLVTGVSSIQSALSEQRALIDRLTADIATLRATIDFENKQLMASQISVGVGLFMMVAGLGLTLATGGAGAVVLGAGILTVIGGGIGWGIWKDKIDSAYKQIASDQQQIDAANQQIAALSALNEAVGNATTWIATASQALSDVRATWNAFGSVLDGVITDLGKPNAQLPIVVDEMWVRAAQNKWNDLQTFAQDLMESSVSVDTKSFSLPQAA